MSKKKLAIEEIASRSLIPHTVGYDESTREQRIAYALHASWDSFRDEGYGKWDDLDALLAVLITNEADAKRIVNALLDRCNAINIEDMDSVEEIVIRILDNYKLRFDV